MSAAKLLLSLLLATGLSAAAWQFGRSFSGNAPAVKKEKKLFSDKDGQYADTSGVIKQGNSIPNSLGYVNGSLDGMTPEQRAAKAAADAEAARKAAEADAAAKKAADDEAARKAKEDADREAAAKKSGKGSSDPTALAGALSGLGKDGGKTGKFGSLSGLGGLSGGSGLSGGINQSFKTAMAGTKPNGTAGSLSAFRSTSKPGMEAGGRSVAGASKSKGFAKRQLDNAFTQSKAATAAGKTENASSQAAVPFDGNNNGGGSTIAGPGTTSGPTTGGADGGTPVTPPGGGSGPVTPTTTAACDTGYNPDINGNCVKTATPQAGGTPNYQWMITAVEALMAVVMILSIWAMLANAGNLLFGAGEAIKSFIRTALIVVGALITALGLMLMSASGDYAMGGVITAAGAAVTLSAFFAEKAGISTKMAIIPLIASIGGAMAAANAKHPAAMQ
jgi:hypothetical protein